MKTIKIVMMVVLSLSIIKEALSYGPLPEKPIRTPAEFEPVDAVVLCYDRWDEAHLDIEEGMHELMKYVIDANSNVIILAGPGDESFIGSLTNDLDQDRIEIIILPGDPRPSQYARDETLQTIYYRYLDMWNIGFVLTANQRSVCSPIVNSLGYNADTQLFDCSSDLNFQGGDFMTDGCGFSVHISSEFESRDLDGNSLPDDYYGIDRYVILNREREPFFLHVDCEMKFLDEETILVGRYWDSDPSGRDNKIEEDIRLIREEQTKYGKPFRIIEVPSPYIVGLGYCSYANSLIVNDHVIVPQYGISPYDEDAIASYKNAMPGYTVVGINFNSVYNESSIHCLTHEINRKNIIQALHPRFYDEEIQTVGVPIHFNASYWSSTDIVPIKEALVCIKWPGQNSYIECNMMKISTNNYHVEMAPPLAGTAKYYIKFTDQNGNTGYKPQNAYNNEDDDPLNDGYLTLEIIGPTKICQIYALN